MKKLYTVIAFYLTFATIWILGLPTIFGLSAHEENIKDFSFMIFSILIFGALYVIEYIKRDRTTAEVEKLRILYKNIFDENPIGIGIIDSEQNIKEANPALCNFLGYERAELLKMTLYDVSVREDLEEELRMKKENIEKFSSDKRYICEDGSVKWGRLNVKRVSPFRDGKKYFLGMVENIDIRKKEEDRLNVLSYAVEQSPIVTLVTDTEGKIVYANKKAVELSGYEIENVVGKNPKIYGSGKQSKEFYENLWSTIKNGGIWHGEFINRKANGEEYVEKAVIGPVYNSEGQITNFIAIKEDITELKITMEEINRARKIAERANEAKSDFLANMSHELRTPLNGILGFISIMKEEKMSKEQLEMVEIIDASSEHLLMLINELLDFAKIEAKTITLSEKKFKVYSLMQKIVHTFANICKEKDVELAFENKIGDELIIISDEQKLKQILLNVVGNAVKFTIKGKIILAVNCENKILKIRVEDSGIGIPKAKMEKLYEPFMQGEAFLRKRYGGTGLGLPIVKKYVEILNGDIEIASIEGKGTKVEISIPVEIFTEEIVLKKILK